MDCPHPLWLKFLDESSKIIIASTAAVCFYTRSAGVIYFAAGAVACALSAKICKMVIKQERPAHASKVTYGMPSTHASACMFFAAYSTLANLYLPPHPSLHPVAAHVSIFIPPLAGIIVLSRVWLGHHTRPQIAAGTAFGVLFASIWFKLWIDDVARVRSLGWEAEQLVQSFLTGRTG
ncbi:hypothetical protein F5I97DRAFT_1846287 [Phlebopus sp. FC_14]|nr:hypothetical protein F5I97DRAFT_1846287 [Phlebopus sp. FC_14]